MRLPWEELEPASQGAVERQHRAVRHITHFTNTVFAVAMALLVLQLVDYAVSSVSQAQSLLVIIRMLWPALAACALGFLVLFVSWMVHHVQFNYLTKSSGGLLLLHVLMLSSALLLPVSTVLLNNSEPDPNTVAIYTGHVLVLQLLLLLTWRHAVKGGLLFGSDVPARIVFRLRLMLRWQTILLIVIFGLAFANPALSLGALAGVFAISLLLIAKGGYTLDLRIGRGQMMDT